MISFKNSVLVYLIIFNCLSTQAVSVKEYVEGALKSNPSTTAALERVHSAEIGVEAARLAYLPKVSLSYSYNVSNINMPPIETKSKSGTPAVSMSLMLWDNGIRIFSIELAEEALKGTTLGVRAARQALIMQTLKTYAAWDGQSSLEYTYATLALGIEALRDGLAKANKLSDSGRKLLDAKIDEYKEKQRAARIVADVLSIQVEGISGIIPIAYVDSSKEDIAIITKFYNDLLLERPLPSEEEAESNLLKNNLSIIASQNGIRSLRISQSLTRAATMGPKVSLTASLSSSRGKSEILSGDKGYITPIAQRGNSIGVTVSIPFDVQGIKNLQKNGHDELASALTHDQLVKDLKTAVKASRVNVSIVRSQVAKMKETLFSSVDSSKDFFKGDFSDANLTNFLVYMGSVEQKAIIINGQAVSLFSSTIDFISLVYNLEDYLKDLKY